MQKILISAMLFFQIGFLAHAQNHRVGVEIDPAPFILNGYSVSIKYSPAKLPKTSFMGSVYGSDFPDGMMLKQNRDAGWKNMKLRTSYAFFTDFYLKEGQRGLHYGPSVFFYNKSASLGSAGEEISFSTVYPNVRVGYIWYPFKKANLYLNPWFNVGSEINVDQKNHIGNKEFKPNSFNYVVALHVGYAFQRK
jgi:hypothetical protein